MIWPKSLRVGTFGGYFVQLKKISDDPENGHENEEMKRRSGKFTFFSKMSQNDQEMVDFDHFYS